MLVQDKGCLAAGAKSGLPGEASVPRAPCTTNVAGWPYQKHRIGALLQRSFATSPESRVPKIAARRHCGILAMSTK
jgi:hypothetical protein